MCGRTREGIHGQIWLVDRDAEVKFVKVWESFISDHFLEFRDFLVFNMDNASFFKVHIFGTCDHKLGADPSSST